VKPPSVPIGLHLAQTAKAVSRAFDDALTAAGGSRPTWLVLLAVKTRRAVSQRELADAVGIQGATLTHHLAGMEAAGLVARRRDPDNRRVQFVALTDAGEEMFLRLREAAVGFDRRLRRGLRPADVDAFADVLTRLERNVGVGD
jgi:MarR family transcriptional regulator for hemolysin